jgi:hypothetical protein
VGAEGEALDGGLAQTGVGEDRDPLAEGQVGGDDDAAGLGALGEDLEEELGAGGGQADVAELVGDHEVDASPAADQA